MKKKSFILINREEVCQSSRRKSINGSFWNVVFVYFSHFLLNKICYTECSIFDQYVSKFPIINILSDLSILVKCFCFLYQSAKLTTTYFNIFEPLFLMLLFWEYQPRSALKTLCVALLVRCQTASQKIVGLSPILHSTPPQIYQAGFLIFINRGSTDLFEKILEGENTD